MKRFNNRYELDVQKYIYSHKKCVAKSHSAKYVGLAEPLGELPFGIFHRPFALVLSILKVCNFERSNTALRNYSIICQLLLSLAYLVLFLRAWNTRTLGGQMCHSVCSWRSSGLSIFISSAYLLTSLICSSILIPEDQGFNISYLHKISIWWHHIN